VKIKISPAHHKGYLNSIFEDLKSLNHFSGGKYEIEVDPALRLRYARTLIFQVGDKKILLDGNDEASPTLNLVTNGSIKDYALALKLQYRPHEVWKDCPIPITAWTYTERYNIFRQSGNKYNETPKLFKCGFVGRGISGKIYRRRQNVLRQIIEFQSKNPSNVEFKSWHNKQRRVQQLTPTEYMNKTMTWQTGLVPIGQGRVDNIDGKTWREIEFASIGMPIIMERGRNYWVPLVENEHYIPLSATQPLEVAIEKAIEDKDIGNRLHNWYNKIASAEGVCKTFVEIIEKYM